MKSRKTLSSVAVLLALSWVCSLTAWAQYGASLQGTVHDKSGANLAGAQVTVTDQATGVVRTGTTNADGFYRFSELPPGTYSVTVDAAGFKSQVTSDVAVAAESARGLDVRVEIGSAKETVPEQS